LIGVRLDPDLTRALRAQLAYRDATLEEGARQVGWKVAGAIPEVDALTGGDPLIGFLTSATVLPDGGTVIPPAGGELYAETELVLDGAGYAVGLELVDTARPPHAPAAILAGNVFHHAAALGMSRDADPGPEARLWVDGELRARAPVTTDAEAVRARVAALLDALGLRLDPGDRLLAGALLHVPVRAGQGLRAEIDGLGSIALQIAGDARLESRAGR
jgi:2-keto-4-pentenoate hydratase